MSMIRLLLPLLLITWLSSCVTVSEQPQVAQNESISWETRVQTLSNLQTWDLKGLIAIRQGNNAVSANLQWQQQHHNYHISLFGPLGSHSYELNGRPGRVELASGNGQRRTASSPEQLLAQEAGWQLPISNLYYWVRGIPVPDLAAQKKLDRYNHLIQLKQQGWDIQYLRYTSVGKLDLPSKIFLNNPALNVKIVISQWVL